MQLRTRLLFGPLALALLAAGIALLSTYTPGYSSVRQTVSEIGQLGAPAQVAFALLLLSVAACTLVFAHAMKRAARQWGQSQAPAHLVTAMAASIIGVALFAHPHPLHNVFGLTELVGYQAPLVFAVLWRRDPRARRMVALSWALYLVIVLAIVANLSALLGMDAVWALTEERIGVAQRLLFGAWFGWCAVIGWSLRAADWQTSLRHDRVA